VTNGLFTNEMSTLAETENGNLIEIKKIIIEINSARSPKITATLDLG
jgi:hypothetical protein